MRILVYEFASGGGLAGRDVPPSLAREGAAMRAAVVGDLSALRCHQIVTTADARVRHDLPVDVDVVTLPAGDRARQGTLDRLIDDVDAVWLIAPETDRCLERLAARVERRRKTLLGSCAGAVACASDKARLPRRLSHLAVRHPGTRRLGRTVDAARAGREMGYPIVVKPARGAGSHGICIARGERELRGAIDVARRAAGRGAVLLQQYVHGSAVSVSLLADGHDAVPLTVNAQTIDPSSFAYRGGETPFDHPLAARAIASAVDVCRALPGLRGFVGVDAILTESEAVVIEVNPRLTTAYLGVRAALDENVAALALAACAGNLPAAPRARRRVRFTASGRIVARESLRADRGAA